MKKYKYLFKPLFYIFNLIFASILVLSIEHLRPSNFGQYESVFGSKPQPIKLTTRKSVKEYLEHLAKDYKKGKIDSVMLNKELDKFLMPSKIYLK